MGLSLRIYSQRGSIAARRAGSSMPLPEFQADDPPERHPSRRCSRGERWLRHCPELIGVTFTKREFSFS